MKKVVHILRHFGHPNQSYTTKLLETLNKDSKQLKHVVLCDSVIENSKTIHVVKTNPYKTLYYHPMLCFFALKQVFFDPIFIKTTQGFSFKKKLKQAIKWQPLWKLNPQVIHVHHLQVVELWLLQYIKSKQIRSVLSLRGMELMRDTLHKEDHRLFLKKTACVDKVHVISQFMLDYALEKAIPEQKIIKVNRGFEKAQILPENLKTTVYKKDSPIKIIAVGRLAWEKGQDQLLASVARLKENGHLLSLDIYGEGPLEAYLKLRTTQLGLTNEVCFKGHVSNLELKKAYKAYDVAVQPSLFEALSNGLLDLVMHQLPCVIPEIGGMPEIITHKHNGIIYNPEIPETLDQAILEALFLNQDLMQQANKILVSDFSLVKELQGYQNIYLSNS
jgi:glycosyltransferase involved in cell wall biosynthesis